MTEQLPSNHGQPRASAAGQAAAKTARLPIWYFVVAEVSFAVGMVLTPMAARQALRFFYGPAILAVVHTFTLGFISSTIMGVMYRYLPGLAHRELPYPRLAWAQLWVYVVGAVGLPAHMWFGDWTGTWMTAAVVLASAVMLGINLWPLLRPGFGRGAAETGMFLSIVCFVLAAFLGMLMALEEVHGFLWGTVLSSIGSHFAFAVLGWVTLTICAASYRFIPAFILPEVRLPKAALWQLWLLFAGAGGLGLALLPGARLAVFLAVLVAAALALYLGVMARLLMSRRMALGWPVGHAIAAMVWLVVGVALGMVLAVRSGVFVGSHARLVAAFGCAALFGWIANFIMGMSYHLFPGFVARVRSAFGWPGATAAELSPSRLRGPLMVGFNLGLAFLAAGMLYSAAPAVLGGALVMALAAIIHAATALRTLSYAFRRALPPSARHPLRILPG